MAKRNKGDPLPPPPPPPLTLRLQYFESFKEMTHEEVGRLLMAVLEYAVAGTYTVNLGPEKILFPMLKKDRDADAKKWIDKVEHAREVGKSGGRPPKQRPSNDETKDSEESDDTEDDEPDEETQRYLRNLAGSSETQKTPYTITDTSSSPYSFPNSSSPESIRSGMDDCSYLTDYDDLAITTEYARNNISGFTEWDAHKIVTLMTMAPRMPGELIRYAIDAACGMGKNNGCGYVYTILDRYQRRGFKTLKDVREDDKLFSQAKRDAVTGRKQAQIEPSKPKIKFGND